MRVVNEIIDAKHIVNMTSVPKELAEKAATLLQDRNYYGYGHFCMGAVLKAFKELEIATTLPSDN